MKKAINKIVPQYIEFVSSYLADFLKLELEKLNIEFEHLTKGFTDNVFLIKTSDKKFVLKEYTESWHNREAKVYRELLAQNSFLNAPKLIYSNEKLLLIEFIETSSENMNPENLANLVEWIINKHNYFINKLDNSFEESTKVRYYYLVEKPFSRMESYISNNVKFKREIQNIIASKQIFIESLDFIDSFPKTLEHGDLEPQNLLIDQNNNLKIVDWVNTKSSSGLMDINQLIENITLFWKWADVDQIKSRLKQEIDLKDFEKSLKYSRLPMLANKINFYLGKSEDGVKISLSNGLEIEYMLSFYLNEANEILESLWKAQF